MIQEFATGFAFVYALEEVGDKYGIEWQQVKLLPLFIELSI